MNEHGWIFVKVQGVADVHTILDLKIKVCSDYCCLKKVEKN
jgi:hypothetical protein